MWKYEKYLPKVDESNRLNLGEGGTPLIKSKSIGLKLGLNSLYFKLENLNPTGSYKDRFASVFVSRMKEQGQTLCVATSSGNTGAALSAYSAAAGIQCVLAIVDGAPIPKIKQMQLYGANTIMVEKFGIDPEITRSVFEQLEQLTSNLNLPLPVSAYLYCAEGMMGVQTIMYEILDQINADHVFCPAGGGGLTLAMAKGAIEFSIQNGLNKMPKVHCVQPEGNDTMASALRNGLPVANPVKNAFTKVSGLQVPSVLDGDLVIETCRKIGGTGYVVTDESVFEFQKLLAQSEGIFCEPAGAVALAGLNIAINNQEIDAKENIVCLITGSGFKDVQSVDKYFGLNEILKVPSKLLIDQIKTI